MIHLPNQFILRFGSNSPEVGNWQRFLNTQGLQDRPIAVSELFSIETVAATTVFQQAHGLAGDGIVGPKTRSVAIPLGFVEFVQAKHFTPVWPGPARSISMIVIHTMECLETAEAADNVALWFAGQTKYEPPQASAHFCIDDESTVQCVRTIDIAWHAKQVNDRSIGIEHAGFAKQTAVDWQNAYAQQMLTRSARLAKALSNEFDIPAARLSVDEVRSKIAGFCGHVDVTNAYNAGVGHVDPGQAFPWDDYLDLVRRS